MLKHILTGLVVAVVMTGAAVAGPMEDGYDAIDRCDYATAVQLYRPLAEQDNVKAQFMLGTAYRGLGNGAEAAKWYRKVAEYKLGEDPLGHMLAQDQLGHMC